MRRGDHRDGMAVGGDDTEGTQTDHKEQGPDEHVGRDEKGDPGVLGTAHVDEREDGEDEKAEREGMGKQGGKR